MILILKKICLLNLSYFSLILILLFSCNKPKAIGIKFSYDSFPEQISIESVELNFKQNLSVPTRVFLCDSILLLTDLKSDNFIHIIDVKNNKYLKNIGTKGRGPGEFLSAYNIITNPVEKSSFWLYDITLNKLTKFNFDSLLRMDNYVPNYSISFSDSSATFYNPIWINDSILVSPVFQGGGRLGFANKFGEFYKLSGNFPLNKPNKSVPDQIHAEAYQGYLACNLKRERMVLVTRYASQIEIYDLNGTEIKILHGPVEILPDYEVAEAYSSPVFSLKERRFGYCNVWANEKYIFTLYSGKSKNESKQAHLGHYILVYDWDGNPLKCMQLDQPVLGMAIDDSKKKIYSIIHSPEPEIVTFTYENI